MEICDKNKEKVFTELCREREYQRRVWGTRKFIGSPNGEEIIEDTPHSVGEFLLYMQHFVTKATAVASTKPSDEECLGIIREITALGMACLEQHGVPPRAIPTEAALVNRRDSKLA